MLRLIGFLMGVLLTGSLALLTLQPDALSWPASKPAIEPPVAASTVDDAAQDNPPAHPAVEQPPAATMLADPVDGPPGATTTARQADGELAAVSPPPAPPGPATRRTLFWQPFRSQYAARGFAGRISRATGVDVQVVQLAPGEVRVALPHTDEAERDALIARIETIAGLQISGELQ